jgi:uncharacterized protein (TIGR03086 family)
MDAPRTPVQGGGMDVEELHRRTVGIWTDRLKAVEDDAWDRPTPSTEWSVRALVNHVVGEDAWTVPLMNGRTIEDVGDSLDGDLLGDDPVGTGTRSAAEAVGAVADRLPSGERVHLSYGEETGEEYVRQLAADHLVHAWDLAAATGGDRSLDPDLVVEVATWFAEREQMYRDGGAIGPRVDASGDPQSELLAASGRDPGWTPPQP